MVKISMYKRKDGALLVIYRTANDNLIGEVYANGTEKRGKWDMRSTFTDNDATEYRVRQYFGFNGATPYWRRWDEEETWKTLWWNTRYEVSNLGRVRNRKSGKILATNPTKSHKKPQVWLYTDYFNSTLQYTLDKLVYFTFNGVSSRSEVKRVKHRDGNIMNCKLDNLYI